MRIGYPCINLSVDCRADRTFRLKSFSQERFIETVTNNLTCLERIFEFNIQNGILFFRITSDLIPFASHPVCTIRWQDIFSDLLRDIGRIIRSNRFRISMHPDQFIVLNSLDEGIFERSMKELEYHAQVLDLLGLACTAKIQLHVGGKYGDKQRSIERFIRRFQLVDEAVKRRLVIENDDRSYTLRDCLSIHENTGIPVLFDVYHHTLNSSGEAVGEAVSIASRTWQLKDGILMVDYSTALPGGRRGAHANRIEEKDFEAFLDATRSHDFDIMLEIKDKEQSALRALWIARNDARLVQTPPDEDPTANSG